MNLLEVSASSDVAVPLVDALWGRGRPGGHVVGLTGPPGVGKSSLVRGLVQRWRDRGLTVGVVAVDPSSTRTGGALLGDRARMARDPSDAGVFIRSLAARGQLGGLAPAAFGASVVMRAAFDRVLVETVGVGQSETSVRAIVDTTVVVVQPASGDALQYLKAGLMEIPDLLVVNKADLGAIARRTWQELRRTLRGPLGGDSDGVHLVSAVSGEGLDDLVAALEARGGGATSARDARLREHVVDRFAQLHGTLALQRLGGRDAALARLATCAPGTPPGALLQALAL